MMLTRFKLWIAGAVALVLAVLGAWVAGRREARQEARTEALEGYARTRRDMDDADASFGDNPDPAAIRQWLSERGKH